MKEAFEKIKDRLEEEAENHRKYWSEFGDEDSFGAMNATFHAQTIVSEVEAEYGNGKTNADRIRAMSDEELAELTLQHDDEYGYFYCSDGTSYQDYGNGYEEALKHEIEWLKSPTTD